jgi:hypothetical protein
MTKSEILTRANQGYYGPAEGMTDPQKDLLQGDLEALMDPKSTIFNRAKEYVRVNYDEATAKMFEEVMTEQFGVQPKPPERDQRMAPAASNAIYAGGGGGGG